MVSLEVHNALLSQFESQRFLYAQLQSSIDKLTETVTFLSARLESKDSEISELKRMLFGSQNERMPEISSELRRKKVRGASPSHAQTQKKRTERRVAKKKLDTIEIVHDLKSCPGCGSENLSNLNCPEVSSEYEHVPSRVIQKRHIRVKKKCDECAVITTAVGPLKVTEGTQYGPGLHAWCVVQKCVDSIPLHRQAKSLEREGVPMSRSTLTDLFHRTADLLEPLAKQIGKQVRNSPRINADETPISIQAKGKCKKGYVWTFLCEEQKLSYFTFSPNRSGETPTEFLKDTLGYLQVDAYTGYNAVVIPGARKRVSCLAHIRRYFFKSLQSSPKDATEAMGRVLKLYEIEYEAVDKACVGTAKHLSLRQRKTKVLMDDMEIWLKNIQPNHPPKSPMGKAIGYALKNWENLGRVCEDAKLKLDNNLAERALRLIALGRKNFLFVGNNAGGKSLATLQTLVSTCLMNKVEPRAYLADVLIRIQTTPSSKIDELLPQNWEPLSKGN